LENAWSAALKAPDVHFRKPAYSLSLVDFPRYYGASWPHNDIAVYIPDLRKVAVMKLSDSRFEPLRRRLLSISMGTNPFIGTSFEIRHAKLNPVFNRIKCSRAKPIQPESFRTLESFEKQLNELKRAYVDPKELKNILTGSALLDLARYIIARYGNNYVLMDFVVSDAQVKTVVKHRNWDHSFRLEVDGMETSAWMFRNALFDPNIEPKEYRGLKVRFAGFVLIGRSALYDYRTSIHLMAIHSEDGMSVPDGLEDRMVTGIAMIKDVEEELLTHAKEIWERRKAFEQELELEEELIIREAPKLQAPAFIEIQETDLSPIQGRVLTLLSSDRRRGFKTKEIAKRIKQEGIRDASVIKISKILDELCAKELAFQNIFGDKWYLNPAVKIVPAKVLVPLDSVEARVLEFLQSVYPTKVGMKQIVRKLLTEDSRLKPHQIIKAVRRQLASQKLLSDKMNRCYANPYPPHQRVKPKPKEKRRLQSKQPTQIRTQFIKLVGVSVTKLLEVAPPKVGGVIHIYRDSRVDKKLIVHKSFDISIMKEIVSNIKSGRFSSVKFTDFSGGEVEIWSEMGELRGTYSNSDQRLRSYILSRLRA